MHFWRRWCARTHTFVNKFSKLSPLVAQTVQSSYWDSTWFTMSSKSRMTLLNTLFIWDNIILDRFTHKCSLVNWSLVRLAGWTRSIHHLFVWVYRKGCLFLSNFIVCKSWNLCRKLSTTNSSENYSPYVQRMLTRLDACAVEPGWRFVTERNLVPRAHVPFGQHQDTESWC